MGKVFRVVICGMKNVGKTSILEQAIYGLHRENSNTYPTIEDIYVANVETDRGTKEVIRFYDTSGINPALSPMSATGDQNLMMQACGQLARQYNGNADAYILVYDVARSESLDCLITLKKEIDKVRDKKEAFYIIMGHCTTEPRNDSPVVNRALQWSAKEKLPHFQVNDSSRPTLYDPFKFLASKISCTPNKSSFSQLAVGRKNARTDSSG